MIFSVIVPVYNDPDGLRTTLDSLTNQDFGGEYEVLPVNNNSTDNTCKVIEEFEKDYPNLVRGLEENNIQSSYAARNKGIKNSKGELLCFVDADMWVSKDWLSSIYTLMNSSDASYVGCNVEVVRNSDSFASFYNSLKSFNIERYLKTGGYAPTCCLVVRNSVFDEVDLFDSRLISGGDKEFGQRIEDLGFSQYFAEDIVMYHPSRDSISSTLKKSKRVGMGLGQLHFYYPDRYGDRSVFDPRNFLPPNPSGFDETFRNWEYVGKQNKVLIYFFEYLSKVLKGYGRIIGYFSSRF